jgi:peptidoglycan DL-endopeptidase CwlO
MTDLKIASIGEDVRRLQEILNGIIIESPPLHVDGIFGQKTKERVILFQRQENLVLDGIVGPKTNKALIATVFDKAIKGLLLPSRR